MSEGEGPIWVPVVNAAEVTYGIPSNLLARIAYQESHFRRDIIDGTTKSAAGAVGIMQLLPQFFPGAGADPTADINTAGGYLAKLYKDFTDWQLALAAYNWGPGSVQNWLNRSEPFSAMPTETQDYVVQITADVPVQGALV
jgi:soluble lytic murein transglycosylase-like protein